MELSVPLTASQVPFHSHTPNEVWIAAGCHSTISSPMQALHWPDAPTKSSDQDQFKDENIHGAQVIPTPPWMVMFSKNQYDNEGY